MKNFRVIICFAVLLVLANGCVSRSLQYSIVDLPETKVRTLKYYIEDIHFAGSWDGGKKSIPSKEEADRILAMQIREKLIQNYQHIFSASKEKTIPVSLVLVRVYNKDRKKSESSLIDAILTMHMDHIYDHIFLVQAKCYNEISSVSLNVQYKKSRVVITWFDLLMSDNTITGNYPCRTVFGDCNLLNNNTEDLYTAIIGAMSNLPEGKIKQHQVSHSGSEVKLLR